jgi:hypothetical protein
MQEELVRMVAQKTGLPEDKARSAAETVIGYLKQRLPSSIGDQLDNPGGGMAGSIGDAAKSLGNKI